MSGKPGFWVKARALLDEPVDGFVELVRRAGVNPGKVFRRGDLRGCDLSGENLHGFDLSHADLTGADLRGADLSGTAGIDTVILSGAIWDELTKWPCPAWADVAGRDVFGFWVSFTISSKAAPPVSQRLRWIPPGAFRMGSPEGEIGRFDDTEGLSDTIVFAQGFWMFDSPCTQALWMAVMGGKNPSHFKGRPNLPVEQVSFSDAKRFIQRLNRLKPGLGLSLPSEAQWEYACRAGTVSATYAGEIEVAGDQIAPHMTEIAWYDGNASNETHPVKLLKPNAWGLYDMLGNVWEWCADEWHETHVGAHADGTARDGSSAALRVVRGGAWGNDARYVRAAYRDGILPSARDFALGFRCARGHEQSRSEEASRA